MRSLAVEPEAEMIGGRRFWCGTSYKQIAERIGPKMAVTASLGLLFLLQLVAFVVLRVVLVIDRGGVAARDSYPPALQCCDNDRCRLLSNLWLKVLIRHNSSLHIHQMEQLSHASSPDRRPWRRRRGLHAALALAKDGHRVTVFDSTKESLEVQYKYCYYMVKQLILQCWGMHSGTTQLVRFSLSGVVDLHALRKEVPCGNRFVDWRGNRLLDCAFDDVEERYGASYYFVHKADLIDALAQAVKQNPNIELLMDSRIEE